MCGERISWGSGDARRVVRRDCRILRATKRRNSLSNCYAPRKEEILLTFAELQRAPIRRAGFSHVTAFLGRAPRGTGAGEPYFGEVVVI